MANPFTIAGLGFQVIGGLFQASAQERAAAKQQAMFNYKAQLNEEEAVRVQEQTKEQTRNFKMQVAQERGQNLVGIAANSSGMSQSARAMLQANASMAARDELNIKLAGDRRAEALREEARLNRMGGDSARSAGQSLATATILNTASGLADKIWG